MSRRRETLGQRFARNCGEAIGVLIFLAAVGLLVKVVAVVWGSIL